MKSGATRLAPKFQTGFPWSFSTNSSLEIALMPVVSEMTGNRAAFASPIRLNAAATRRSAATTSGRRSSSSEGSPAGTSPGKPGSVGRWRLRPRDSGRAGARALESLARGTARAGAGRRDSPRRRRAPRTLLLIADPDAHSVIGQTYELLARTNGLAGRLGLQPRLGGEEPALGHQRRNRLSRVLEIRLRRRGLGGACRPAVAHSAPEVELPGCVEDTALEARAVAGQLAATTCQESTDGYSFAPASLAWSSACSTRVAPTRRSALCAMASATAAAS